MKRVYSYVNSHPFLTLAFTFILSLIVSALSEILIFQLRRISLKIFIIPLGIVMGVGLTFIVLVLGLKLSDIKIKPRYIFTATLAGTGAFVLEYLTEFFWLLTHRNDYKGFELANFTLLSVYQVFHPLYLPSYLNYPLQTINLWEVINLFIIIYFLIKAAPGTSKRKLAKTVMLSYCSGVFAYFLLVTFINITLMT